LAAAQQAQLRAQVSRLRPKLRAIVIPYIFEGRLISEIITALKIPEKTAYARLSLARKELTRRPRLRRG
jgi:DNA-directed RNA polymerase specialized sigma24 family protein